MKLTSLWDKVWDRVWKRVWNIHCAGPRSRAHWSIDALEPRILLAAQPVAFSFEQTPLVFDSHQGQADTNLAYVSRGADLNVSLLREGAVLDFGKSISTPMSLAGVAGVPSAASPAQVTMTWQGGNASPTVVGLGTLSDVANSISGNDPSGPGSEDSSVERVEYVDVYNGINLDFYARGGNIEFDWVVAPRVDASQITMLYAGMDSLSLDAAGDLVMTAGGQEVVQHAPVVYQMIAGEQRDVAASYRLGEGGTVRFVLGAYDPDAALVIDPVLTTSTYLGGSRDETVKDMATDALGNTYVVGTTHSADFAPGSVPDDVRVRGFITKLDAAGQIVYTKLLGPVDSDEPFFVSDADAVKVGPDGLPIVSYELTAYTELDEFGGRSITGATRHVVKLTNEGATLFDTTVASWSLGFGRSSMAVDEKGSAYLSVQGQDEVPFGIQENALIAKVDADGTLVFAQPFFTQGAIAVDAQHNIYLAAETSRDDLPVTTGAFQPQKADTSEFNGDLYVAELDPTASGLMAATYLGGSLDDRLGGLAVNPDRPGIVYLTGNTTSADFPVEAAFQKTLNPVARLGAGVDGFITALDLTKMKLVTSTFFGGSGWDRLTDIALDKAGNVYVAGTTDSLDFPVVDPLLPKLADGPAIEGLGYPRDFVIARFDASLLAPSFATYFGGTGDESGARLALDPNGTLHVAGTSSGAYLYRLFDHSAVGPFATADFPILNAAQPGFAGGDGSTAIAIGDPFLMTDAVVFSIGQDLTVTAQPVRTVVGEAYTQAVATFTAPDPTAPASNFTAEINWGDGAVQPDFGTVRKTGDPSAPFEVVGNHTYARPGSYPVVVTVTDIKYNIRATTAYDVSQARNNQSETNIAVDPNDAHRVFAVANDFLNLVNDNSNLFAGFSADGGITWTSSARAGVLTPAAGADPLPAFGGDPRVAFDQFGNLYLTALRRDHNEIVVLLSADGGKTFRLVGEFPSQGGASGAAGEDPEQAAVDQPSIAVGPGDLPGTGSVWISYADVNADTVFAAGARVTGLGQVGDFQLIDLAHGQFGNFGNIAVGPAGQVVATWQNFGSDATKAPPDAILVSSNPDGLKAGASFSPPVVLSPIPAVGFGYVIPPQATRNIAPDIRLAWDKSGGPHNGRLYLAYTDALAPTAAPNDTDIFERHSDDGGATWSEPVKVNDDAGGHSQFFASIAVDQSTGDLGVAWYDARNSATNTTTQFFVAVSGDGGQTFSANVAISAGPSDATDADLNKSGAAFQYGDYTGLEFAHGLLYPVWADNSSELAHNPNRPQFDVAASRVAVAHVVIAPPVVTGVPLTIAEGQTFSGTVATFADADQSLTATDFTARIDWGDGTPTSPSVGIITSSGDPDHSFIVRGSHVYATPGAYVIGIKVTDNVHNLDGTLVSDVSQAPGVESEGTIAIDPSDPSRLFAVSNRSGKGMFGAYSTDGGVTWNGRRMAGGLDGLPVSDGDPKVVFDQYGNLFLTYLTAEENSAVVAVLSTDGGQSFHVLETFSDPGGTDQPSVAVGPGAGGKDGSVWVTFVLLSDNSIVAAGASVSGPNLVGSFSELQVVPGPEGGPTRNFGDVAVGPNGQVLITYQAPTGGAGPSQVFVSLDTKGLQEPTRFGPPILVTATNVGGFDPVPAQATRKIDAEANLAWDLTNGPHRGRLYLAYTDAPAVGSPDTNIFVRFSDDDGKTWSDRVRVNDDTGSATQLLPSVAVDPTSGDVGVSWYDTRNDPGNVKTQIFAALSSDGGQTFSRNALVSVGTSDATDPGLNVYGQRNQYGDYTGLVFQGGILYPAWADNSSELGANPDLPQFDLAAGRAPTAHVTDLPLTATALDITADVNDEGEEFTADLATFIDADPGARLDLYTATIDWGDKTDLANGTIKFAGGRFVVSGTHAYEEEGPYKITITIKDKGGASVVVTNDTDVADGQLTAQGLDFKPVENQLFRGVVASFTDSDPNGQPNDYAAQINWGDGTQTRGSVAFSGSAALTWDVYTGTFFAIGNNDNLTTITPTGDVANYAALDPSFHRGGLTLDTTTRILYAISKTDAGVSTLNAIDLTSRTFHPVLRLGTGFSGGLAFDAVKGDFYAIADDGTSSSLYQINLSAGTVAAVADLGPLSRAVFGGLTFNPFDGHLYAAGNDSEGASTLYQITPGGTLPVLPLFSLGTGFTGGLAVATGLSAGTLRGEIVGIAGDGSGSAVLNTISLSGPVAAVFEVGASFNDGFDVVGTHFFGEEATLPVDVSIKDAGGSSATAHSSATVVDSAPEVLTAPLAITGLQGVPTGTLDLARFTVPGGAETGPNEYFATINWGDGSPTQEGGGLSVVGSVVTVTGSHTYTINGRIQAASVTLTDDTGNSASARLIVTFDPDVTAQVRAVGSGLIFNPATQHFVGDLNIASTFGLDIPGPFYVVIDGLPAGVMLANAPAMTADGNPLFTIDVPVLSVGTSLPAIPLEFSDPTFVPISYRVRVIDGPGGAAAPAATSDTIVVTNKPIAAVEGTEFSGAVASFVVPASQPQQGFSATIDWGDGAVTPGTVVALTPGVFDVLGTHTYQRNGQYRVPIIVRDASGAEFAAATTPADANVVGSVTYLVTLDTATLQGVTGFLDFQFNAGALPGSPAATAHVTQFVAHGASLLGATTDGVASGDLTTELRIGDGGVLNRFTQGIQFGDKIEFDVTIDGDGIAAPALGLFGDVFAVQLLGADGVTPLLSADKTAAALSIDLEPDGSTQSHAFPPDTAGSRSVARAVAFDGAAIREAALDALQVPISGVEGNDFSGVVATFTSANPFETAADFTAVIDWADGTPTTSGVITADPIRHLFLVTATHRYLVPGDYAFSVTVNERDGLAVQAALPPGAPELLAGRRTTIFDRGFSGQLHSTGDFNRDGLLDIAVNGAVSSSNGESTGAIYVLLGRGDGSFQRTTLPGGGEHVVAADFNNDGLLDLAVATSTLGVPISIFLGNGDGTFRPPVDGPPAVVAAYDLELGDLNHDGNMDLVVSAGDPNGFNQVTLLHPGGAVYVLLGRGDGTFDYNATFASPFFGFYVLPHSNLQVADVNGDGKLDVVALDSANNVLRVLPGLGNGTFARDVNKLPLTVNTALPAGAMLGAIADLNGDGKLDMAVTATDHVSVLIGKGDGTFQPPTAYDTPAAYDVIAADYNGDGLLDLLVTDNGVQEAFPNVDLGKLYVLLNVGNGSFATALLVTGTAKPVHAAAGDFNGDGRTDVFLTTQEAGVANVLLGAGDGSFLTAQRYDTGVILDPNGYRTEAARAADVNGDGFQDVILLGDTNFGTVGVRLGNGDGTFQTIRSFPLGLFGVPAEVAFGDVNHDGKVDLAVASFAGREANISILLGNGDGTFQPRQILRSVGTPLDIVVTDFNKDGKLDLVVGDVGAVRILLGNADGTFQNPLFVPLPGIGFQIEVRDFNGDGNLDLAALKPGTTNLGNTRPPDSEVYVVLNRGDGTFLPAVTYYTSPAGFSMTSADVNGDGYPDLITAADFANYYVGPVFNVLEGSIEVLLNRGDGTFQPAVRYGIFPRGYSDVITADIDGDGHLDIIAGMSSAEFFAAPFFSWGVAVLRNQGDGTFGAPTFYDQGSVTIAKIAVADFNGDQLPDILAPSSVDNTFSILFGANGRGHGGASISDAAIVVTGASLHPGAGQQFTAVVASFSDANPLSVPGDFTASIDWGDGQTSPGTIGTNSVGGFDVTGTHGYAGDGKYVTTITVAEIGAGTHQGTGAITVDAPPIATDDTSGTNKNTAVVINVLANDSDSDGTVDPTTVAVVAAAGHGTTSVNPTTGAVTYTPASNYSGPDSFTYKFKDNLGTDSNVATVSITVNAPPIATNDTAGTNQNTAAVINVLANDSDSDGTIDPTTVAIVSAASHGMTSVNPTTGAVTYTPTSNTAGPDSFTYTFKDNRGADSNVANVAIMVNAPAVGGAITGTEYLDLTGNGLTADDSSLTGVQIFLDTNNSGSWNSGEPVTTTLADGTYAFTGLAVGTYTIREVVPAGFVRTAPALSDHYTVTVGIGQTSSGNNFAVAELCDKSILTSIVYVINGMTPVSDLRGGTKEGDTVQVSFTVVAGAQPHRFTLVTYTAAGSTFDATTAAQEKIFDSDTGLFGPGTWTLTVSVPHSYYQIDFVCGSAIDRLGPANSNIFYSAQNRLFSADNSGTHAVIASGVALSGSVYLDANNNGTFDSGERPLAGVVVTVSGCSTTQTVVTDAYGVYTFDNLKAGTYTITETQPGACTNGKDTLGNKNGTMSNDKFSGIVLAGGASGTGYNFGEQQTFGSALAGNQTQSIAWWNGSTGQALIKAINGSQSAKNLGNWLAASFSNMFGANAGTANNLTGKTTAQVAAYYQTVYANSTKKAEAEALALALSIYVTNSNLAGTVGTSYGFAVSTTGLGAATVNVGVSGPAFGVNNNTVLTITELLSRTNARARKGILWDVNGNGTLSAAETVLRNQALSLFDAINNT